MTDEQTSRHWKQETLPLQYHASPTHRILVVDDDNFLRKLSTAVLAGSGYEVDFAEDGAAGLKALRSKHYDLLITDHLMPHVTGVEMVKMIRGQDPSLPVIMASGVIPKEVKRHPRLAIKAFLHKPYDPSELLGTVRQVLRSTVGATDQARPSASP